MRYFCICKEFRLIHTTEAVLLDSSLKLSTGHQCQRLVSSQSSLSYLLDHWIGDSVDYWFCARNSICLRGELWSVVTHELDRYPVTGKYGLQSRDITADVIVVNFWTSIYLE